MNSDIKMNLVEESFKGLYPEKIFEYKSNIKYSDQFNSYNANARLRNKTIEIRLSKKWKNIDSEIVIGLIQSLLLKILKDKKETINTDLYRIFVKNLHMAIPKTKSNPALEASFKRVNEKLFFNAVEQPNLAWGQNSFSKLGSYDYHTDTLTISNIFQNEDERLLDYVMYHEILHKKHKFKSKNGRNYFHDRKFRNAEKQYPDSEQIEKEIKKLAGKHSKLRFFFGRWF